ILDGLSPCASVRLDLPPILVSGRLCKWILDLPSEFDAVVRVGNAPLKLTDPRQGVPGEAGRGGLFGFLSQPAHLLHAPRQDLSHARGADWTGVEIVGEEKADAA